MSEREKLKPEENVKIVMKYIAGEVSMCILFSRFVRAFVLSLNR